MAINLSGKVALVTGAARGIGLLVADHLAREGALVAGVDIRIDELKAAMTGIGRKYSSETLALVADMSQEEQVTEMVQKVFAKWGSIDILINNAGIRRPAPVQETSTENWDLIQSVNLRSQFLCTREVLNQGMLKQNRGTIIFLSSDAGLHGGAGSSAYSASKFGVRGFAQSVAKDLKDTKIRTTTILPGRSWTPMAEESEYADMDLDWLDPQAISDAIVFCIKQDSDTIIPELQIYHRAQI